MRGMSDYFVDHLLIAMPALGDPNFARSVTLLCQHDADGAMGLVINRPSDYTLGDLCDQMQIECGHPDRRARAVLLGGPVQPDRGFVLHDDVRDWGSTLRFGQGLAVTTSRDILAAMARGEGPAKALIALGYAGWGAGQLEDELGQNSWLTVPSDQAIVFDLPLGKRWDAAARRLGVDPAYLADYSGRA
jgi:putative transcriptional regulator